MLRSRLPWLLSCRSLGLGRLGSFSLERFSSDGTLEPTLQGAFWANPYAYRSSGILLISHPFSAQSANGFLFCGTNRCRGTATSEDADDVSAGKVTKQLRVALPWDLSNWIVVSSNSLSLTSLLA
jgi:hypothetical protein